MLGKSASTIYAMTSEKRIPYHKRGNKLYFFEDEIIGWIEQGGTSGTGSEEEFNRRLEALRRRQEAQAKFFTDKADIMRKEDLIPVIAKYDPILANAVSRMVVTTSKTDGQHRTRPKNRRKR